ncbi:hypothetical protein B6A10_11885 [Flavobacterium sp. L1I52]|uniref:Uncharacterized protein n=1 Tax=Flavobacterium pokkalii TaxID=1940408 RepID=A0ABR7USJ0_9FLAO|nr:hypothetical protein [Flavobacterium pokkalii]
MVKVLFFNVLTALFFINVVFTFKKMMEISIFILLLDFIFRKKCLIIKQMHDFIMRILTKFGSFEMKLFIIHKRLI